jgi:hypothetical protein
MKPTKGLKNTLKGYAFIAWLYPVLRPLFPKFITTLQEVGLAMINVTIRGYEKQVLEVKDIVKLAQAA